MGGESDPSKNGRSDIFLPAEKIGQIKHSVEIKLGRLHEEMGPL